MGKILGFLVICIPGLILLSNFWWFDYKTQLEKKIGNINAQVQALDNKAKDLEGKIKPINPNKNTTDASSQPTELDNPSKLREQDIQELKIKSETLDKQITLLGDNEWAKYSQLSFDCNCCVYRIQHSQRIFFESRREERNERKN